MTPARSPCCRDGPPSTWCLVEARGVSSPCEGKEKTFTQFCSLCDGLEQPFAGRGDSLAAVDDDVLRPDAPLQHAHLGVVSAATEQTRRLDAEVGDALAMVVHDAEAVLLQGALILLFDFLSAETDQREKLYLTETHAECWASAGAGRFDRGVTRPATTHKL